MKKKYLKKDKKLLKFRRFNKKSYFYRYITYKFIIMKKLKLAVLALFTLVAVSNVNAQDSDNPWAFSLAVNAVDFDIHKGSDQINDFLGMADWNISNNISKFTVEKYLDKGFTLQAAFSLNQLKKSGTTSSSDIDAKYYAFDVNGKYDLNGLVGDTAWFDPYVMTGVSYTVVDFQAEDFSEVMLNLGYGFNFWVSESVGINYQSIWKNNLANKVENHWQHSLGVVFRWGGSSDDAN